MEPGNEHQTQQYGSPGQGAPEQWNEPAKPVRAKDAMARGRTGLIVFIAFLTELVVIAAAGNQWVSDRIARLSIDPNSRIQQGLRSVGVVYAWRFTPQHGDTTHFWAASLALIGTVFVVSALLILAVVRGPVTFGRAFFGSWMAVIVATMLGGYARALVINVPGSPVGNRLEQALFSVFSPTSVTFLAGVGLGLIVAIIVGIVAPLTRRGPAVPLETAVPAGAASGPAGSEGFFGGSQEAPPWREERFGPPPPSDATVANDQPTTALPSYDKSPEQSAAPTGQQDAPTTALPVGIPTERREEDHPTTALTPTEGAESPTDAAGQRPEPFIAPDAPHGYGAAPRSPYSPPDVGAASMPEEGHPAAPEQAAETTELGPQQGNAEPKMAEPEPEHGTAQFPRPPDDEDIDPEHR